jgi:hypothetical protein
MSSCLQVLYCLNHTSSPFALLIFLEMGSHELFPGLPLNLDTPNLSLPINYRHKPLAPSEIFHLNHFEVNRSPSAAKKK